ncbi:hypothetical protein G8770_17235 [Aestuariicella hydrocarbonica]|uniref:Uncharacterized protein n=1 Tax=Pseudomaricurvus hydrocarbonicus TaxID=1470433 RepID=A0A9E5MN55_9GAMM|nr:hypothetical protein [Aestuariicella hydrocarbonica]NHO67295.1 hypothetical protein [Aestuariicella hydrocarbonica]
MNKILLATLTSLIITAPALAAKPETAGNGKSEREPMKTHQQMGKEHANDKAQAKAEPYRLTEEEKRQKAEKAHAAHGDKTHTGAHQSQAADTPQSAQKATEKQQEKKTEQVRKELDKGSEQGQQARAENSKKWWKLW